MATILYTTNRGNFRCAQHIANKVALPDTFFLALATVNAVVGAATKVFSEVLEIVAGNGYASGGVEVARDIIDFPTLVEDDINNRAYATTKVFFIAPGVGETIPISGDDVGFVLLLGANASIPDREVYGWGPITGSGTVSYPGSFAIQYQIRLNAVRP